MNLQAVIRSCRLTFARCLGCTSSVQGFLAQRQPRLAFLGGDRLLHRALPRETGLVPVSAKGVQAAADFNSDLKPPWRFILASSLLLDLFRVFSGFDRHSSLRVIQTCAVRPIGLQRSKSVTYWWITHA